MSPPIPAPTPPSTGHEWAEESREKLELLLSATNDGVVDWDLESGTFWYSLRWKMLLGYEGHELEDAPDLWRTLSHPADVPRVEEMMRDQLENVWPFQHQWRMRHANGEWRWVLCRSVAVRGRDFKVRRIVSVYSDITDRVHAEERYRALADGIPDTILRIRNDGMVLDEKPGTPAIALLDGQTIGRPLGEASADQQWVDRALAAAASASRTGEVVIFEHADEATGACVEVRVAKSSDEESVCLFRDITERKQAERSLVDSLERLHRTQRQLMDASHRAGMAEVASSVLHNVGNVLNSVNVSANAAREIVSSLRFGGVAKAVAMLRENEALLGPFLRDDPKGQRILPYLEQVAEALRDDAARVRRELDSLQGNIDHIKVIVSTQQSHARSHCGVVEHFAPAEVVEDALKLIGAGRQDGFRLVREYADLPEVEADRHKVLQIVTNLLSNARHAVKQVPSPTVTVRIRVPVPDRFIVEVEDTGFGIAAENLKKIFQYGFTTRKDGHGFGLHASANAAHEMGGSLSAYSEGQGQGARFVLDLPVRVAAGARAADGEP